MQMICVWKKYWKTFLSEVPHDRESQGWKTSFKWAIKLNLLLKDGNVSGTSYSSNDCSSVPNSPFTACSADIEMGPSSFRKTNKLRTPTDCTLCLSRDVSPHSLCCNKKPLGSISVPLCTSVIVLLTVCWIYHERHQSSGGDWASCYSDGVLLLLCAPAGLRRPKHWVLKSASPGPAPALLASPPHGCKISSDGCLQGQLLPPNCHLGPSFCLPSASPGGPAYASLLVASPGPDPIPGLIYWTTSCLPAAAFCSASDQLPAAFLL
ncbi:uncharacterized protein LOC128929312 isoform X1 [Callithrix jacchus]